MAERLSPKQKVKGSNPFVPVWGVLKCYKEEKKDFDYEFESRVCCRKC